MSGTLYAIYALCMFALEKAIHASFIHERVKEINRIQEGFFVAAAIAALFQIVFYFKNRP